MTNPIIIWFRNDLRLIDNAPIFNAKGAPIIPIYIYDENAQRPFGAASKYWLNHSLKALENSFSKYGIKLLIAKGDTKTILSDICTKTRATSVFCTRGYEPEAINLEKNLYDYFNAQNIIFKRFSGNLLCEPEEVKNASGAYFQVFTPFYKTMLSGNYIHKPLEQVVINGYGFDYGIKIEELKLLPKINWTKDFDKNIGEDAALKKLDNFINRVNGYGENRNIPKLNATSRLSPHLRFGEISPRIIYARLEAAKAEMHNADCDKFINELIWRDFSYNLLFRYPNFKEANIKTQFDNFPWVENNSDLVKWQKGQTGYPIIDAGMRELWQTGYMHNRVRMIVASFLSKHLLIDWREGEKWFWDCLLDADPASNPASWQWVAGSGMDAAPYFRIFNPITQSEKFDTNGDYIKQFVPELRSLDIKYIHTPWLSPNFEKLGYPLPMIDLKFGRDRALEALQKTKA